LSIDYMPKISSETDVLILCGGAGSRLRPLIYDRPKGLATISGRPFLDILVENLLRQEFRRFIFCVGHLKEQIIEHFKYRTDAEYFFSEENFSLGTGGATHKALILTQSNPILVVNGDSFCNFNFKEMLQFHNTKESAATFIITKPRQRNDGGTVRIDKSNKIISFEEKKPNVALNDLFINAGIYLLKLESLKFLGLRPPFSLEYDIFPKLIKNNSCFGFIVDSDLIDIGTPERYLKANNAWKN